MNISFSIRYGLRNTKVIVFNTLFLIIVLFYVYPLKYLLKFLFLLVLARVFNHEAFANELSLMVSNSDTSQLMIIYGLGASFIFFVLALMYRYALRATLLLDLNRIEEFDTRHRMYSNFLMGAIPLLSAVLAFLFKNNHELVGMISEPTYFLYTPIMFYFNNKMTKRRKKLLEETIE